MDYDDLTHTRVSSPGSAMTTAYTKVAFDCSLLLTILFMLMLYVTQCRQIINSYGVGVTNTPYIRLACNHLSLKHKIFNFFN